MKVNETTRRVIGFSDKYAAFRHLISLFSGLPGLTGLWTAGHLDPTGDWYDWTKNDLTLTAAGTPGLNYHNNLVPYVTFDGATDYFTRADEAATSITGTESHIDAAVRGLTLGAWAYPTDVTTTNHALSKWAAAADYSYSIHFAGSVAGDPVRFYITDDGNNGDFVDSATYAASAWHFIVGRYNDNDTGEELAIWLDGVKTTAATARASVFDGAADFCIGAAAGGGGKFAGRVAVGFLSCVACSDDMIGALFQQSRALYGV